MACRAYDICVCVSIQFTDDICHVYRPFEWVVSGFCIFVHFNCQCYWFQCHGKFTPFFLCSSLSTCYKMYFWDEIYTCMSITLHIYHIYQCIPKFCISPEDVSFSDKRNIKLGTNFIVISEEKYSCIKFMIDPLAFWISFDISHYHLNIYTHRYVFNTSSFCRYRFTKLLRIWYEQCQFEFIWGHFFHIN